MSRDRLLALLLALVTLLVFLPVRHHEFVNYDDPDYVTENRHVQHGLTAAGLAWAFGRLHGDATYYHPLTWVSHMLDCQLFGLDAGAHHVMNVLFHAANAALLFLVLRRMTGARWRSAVVAALFALHPLQVDTVAWVAERKNLLGGLLWLLATAAYVRYAERPTAARYSVVVVLFALGLLAKPVLVTLPCVLLLLDFWPLRRCRILSGTDAPEAATTDEATAVFAPASLGRLLWEKAPLLALALGSCGITLVAHRALGTTVLDLPLSARLENALVSYARYLGKTIWPADLCVIYPRPDDWPNAATAASAALLLAVSSGVALALRRAPWLAVGWFWFLGVLVPFIGIVQAGLQAMADRFAYLPLIGLFLAVVWGVTDAARGWPQPRRWLAALAGLALAGCAVQTWRQLEHWQNSRTLFAHAVAVTRNNAVAHINLGTALEAEGKLEDALAHYREALRLEPRRAQAHNNLGNALDALGRSAEAIAHYEEALRLKPGVALVHYNLGVALAALGRFDDALTNYRTAARLKPEDAHPHYLMGLARLRQGQTAAAIAHFRDALRWEPDHAKTLNQLARVLAADTDPQCRNGAEAARLAERAAELTGFEQPAVLDTLAMAYAETGRFAEAIQVAQRMLELLTAAGLTNETAAIQQRLQRYRGGQPFRESVADRTAARQPK
jgi:tetratricopeptide (TPR) repeat protein